MRVWLLALLLAVPALSLAAALPGPLAPASDGRLQCFVPNLAKKSCQSLDAFARDSSGVIQSTATVLLSSEPLITMTTRSPVDLKDGRVCGPVRTQDVMEATFTVGGQPADPRQTADLRLHVSDAMKTLVGHEICVGYVKNGEAWIAKSFLDGSPQLDSDEAFIWVPPSANYKVSP
jgi:hypothetical protein